MKQDRIQVKIPRKLTTRLVNCTEYRKAVALLLYLKALNDAGRFVNNKKEYQRYARLCGICYGTFLTQIQFLCNKGLVEKKDGQLHLASWQKIKEVFQLGNLRAPHYADVSDVKTLVGKLETLVYVETFKELDSAWNYYIKKTGIKQQLKDVFGTASRPRIEKAQLENFLNWYANMDMNNVYELNFFRADIQCNYKYWNDLFGYKSWGGFAYKKKRHIAMGLITVEHRIYLLEYHKPEYKRKSILGTVKYFSTVKSPVLIMPDLITVL